ncbi:dihydrolipoyl dehydrogenase family protein [Elusimicrobiota bacterium]
MKYNYDLICIGLGPAGLAVSVMGSEMGLKVCAVEDKYVGGECMNVGCIPSKGLLQIAHIRGFILKFAEHKLGDTPLPKVGPVFEKLREDVKFINEKKILNMLKKTDIIIHKDGAKFIDPHTIEADGKRITAKRIFICTGESPAIPDIKGIKDVPILTNENVFNLNEIPESLVILGGGAVGTELAQAFAKLGSKVSIVHKDDFLVPTGDSQAGKFIEEVFNKEGIKVLNGRNIDRVEKTENGIKLFTQEGDVLEGKHLLVAAGKSFTPNKLNLDAAGIKYTKSGITVNSYLQTNKKNIYAVGDCNAYLQLSHAAMHQGMVAIMNSMIPWPFKINFKKYTVPWTIFTRPQVSFVGMSESELKKKKIKYEEITANYSDYGPAIAENISEGYVRVFASKAGKIYGATIIGEGSGEMINEWALAIQKKMRLADIMMLAHSFPTMGFMSKRIGEKWMMQRIKPAFIQKMIQFFFRI